MRHALVTGAAGFIGSHVVDSLLAEGWRVTGIDNFDPFYSASVKWTHVKSHPHYELKIQDIRWMNVIDDVDVIVHLAAKAGVRPSLADPHGYYETNVVGTRAVLEFARTAGVRQVVVASSSSVYGTNPERPWAEGAELMPISPYASTKIGTEWLARCYSQLYGIRCVALRLFTVYGPRQRPDLAIHKFAAAMLNGESIEVYGDGSSSRDYTHISDVVRGIRAAMDYTATPCEAINLGNTAAVSLSRLITELAYAIGVSPRIVYRPEQPGDVPHTLANIEKATRLLGYRPVMTLRSGLASFAEWIGAGQVAA